MPNPNLVLIVDDEPFNLEILQEYLEDGNYSVLQADDGMSAISQLNRHADEIAVVLLDRMMPNMDGMEVLAHMKRNEVWSRIPVVMQTAMGAPSALKEGMQAGAYYYLTKPYDKATLLAVVAAAVKERLDRQRLNESLARQQSCLRLLTQASFELSNLNEAHDITSLISAVFPDPQRVAMGLSELIVNAIEHGNLGVSYREKGELLRAGRWQEEIEARLAQAEYAARRVRVHLNKTAAAVSVRVEDEGAGFDWQPYLELQPERAFDPHGRGISMARMISFDELHYQGRGNVVEVKVYV